ncbi:MAG: nitroreductase family protein [Candidatus Omnitrophica bacterium]|nr:nitroreductase family protein [Candidatus Omnitrophota bacterium]
MNVSEAILSRYSVRKYRDKPVEEDKIHKLLEAARLAPSANNRQEWRFVVVQDRKKRQALMRAAKNQEFVGEAPVVIACCAVTDNHIMTCGQKCYPIDVAIAMEHICLQAVEEGLGTCWIGAFYEESVKEELQIPDEVRVVELLTLGYPADQPSVKNRLRFDEIVMYENWK